MRISFLVFAFLLSASVSRAQFSGPTGQQRADKVQASSIKPCLLRFASSPGWISKSLKATRMS
jgi:hypothetical protein